MPQGTDHKGWHSAVLGGHPVVDHPPQPDQGRDVPTIYVHFEAVWYLQVTRMQIENENRKVWINFFVFIAYLNKKSLSNRQ